MIAELILGVRQKISLQKLTRKNELKLVMENFEQDEEYSVAAKKSSLNVVYDLIVNTILKKSKWEGNALDICCASGELLFRISNELPKIKFVGIDLSENMLKFAKNKNKNKNLSFKKMDMLDIDKNFEKKSFDLITWNMAMHHCETEDDVILMYNKIHALLKDDGSLFIFDLNRLKNFKLSKSLVNITSKGLGKYFYEDSYNSYLAAFTYDEVERMLAKSNLKNFKHVKPFFFETMQVIYISNIDNKLNKKISNLVSKKQKFDYKLLSWGFGKNL